MNISVLILRGWLVAFLVLGIAGVGVFSVSSPAQAAESKEVAARKKLMKTGIKGGMGQIKKGIKAGNSGQMTKGADMIAEAAGRIPSAFAKKDLSGKTRSLKVIWEKKSEFDEIAKALASSAKGFKAAVKTGDKMKIQAAMKMVGANCGKCHKMYRAKKKKK